MSSKYPLLPPNKIISTKSILEQAGVELKDFLNLL